MPFPSSQPVKNLEELLHRMTDRIRQSIELPEILDATVDEMRRFLKTDRVKVYRFHEDHSGEVVAEAIHDQRLPSLLGQRFPAEDIPLETRELFLNVRQRTIVNVARQKIGSSPLLLPDQSPETSTPNICFRSVDPCHIEYLMAMGVQSSLVVPILHRHQLWGLLVSHHSVPRRINPKELEIVQMIADQVAVAISHANLLHITRLQGQHEAVINQVVSLLSSTGNEPLQNALDQTVAAMQCVGGRLYIAPSGQAAPGSQLVLSGARTKLTASVESDDGGSQPAFSPLEQLPEWQPWLAAEAPNQPVTHLWAVSDIDENSVAPAIASALRQKNIRGLLVVELIHRNRFLGYLSLFRQPIDVETVWAGRPDASDTRQERPRQSFEAWREIKANQAQAWSAREIGLAQDLADRFASVIYQTQLYQKVKALNADLEQRVLQRTAELQQLNSNLKQEISERERTLQELQQARDSLKRLSHKNELILSSAGEGIYGIDPEGKVVFVNPAAARILGYEGEELVGQCMNDLLLHAKSEEAPYLWQQNPIYKTLRYGQTHHATGDLFFRKDGTSFPVEYVSTSIRDDGKIVGAVVIFQDITERQMIEAMKDEFIAVVSHELRTPLTSIRAALGLLAQEQLNIPATKRQRMVEIAFSNTNRLVRLVSDILDVERIKLGKVTLNQQVCDMADMMSQAADEMRAMAEKSEIHISVSSFSAQLYADRDKIIQTLTNLLSNAIKFSSTGSTVTMTAQQVDSIHRLPIAERLNDLGKAAILTGLESSEALLLVQVEDQGQGIPEDKLEAIFGQFEQLYTSDDKHHGGAGLGLAICRSIIQQHEGHIWAQSEPGKGSIFSFTLPLKTELTP